MKSAIGEGMTRKDHSDVSNQLYACYAIGKILPISVVHPHHSDADPDADPIRLITLMRIRILIFI
jgi:hypothetical protein